MAKKKHAKGSESTQNELVRCDLEFPFIQIEISKLSDQDRELLFSSVEKISTMTWQQIYATSSKAQKRDINWEVIEGQKTASGSAIASIRIDKKFRGRVTRDSVHMRFVSLHPDHDSAYEKPGGEDL